MSSHDPRTTDEQAVDAIVADRFPPKPQKGDDANEPRIGPLVDRSGMLLPAPAPPALTEGQSDEDAAFAHAMREVFGVTVE